jgi:hypothetical protein
MLPGAAGMLAGGGGGTSAAVEPEEVGALPDTAAGGSGMLSEVAGAAGAGASAVEAVPGASTRCSRSAGRGAGADAVLPGALPLLLSVRLQGPAKAAKPPKLTASPPASSFHRIHSMARCSSLNAEALPTGYPPAATAPETSQPCSLYPSPGHLSAPIGPGQLAPRV